ncbi:MAG: hypothetical protein AB7L90_00495 [Hyphomicrobiaceae bacterium]
MNRQNQKLTLDRLESLLDAYGGDLSRLPDGLAPQVRALIGSSNAARRLYQEAQALDRLLAKASAPDPRRLEKLAQRIVEAAQHEGVPKHASADAGARIIPMPLNGRVGAGRTASEPPHATASPESQPSLRRASKSRWTGGGNWPAVAALAASLACGFAIGFSDVAPNATYNVASLVQRAPSDADAVLSELQLDTLNDEDQI